MDHHIEASKANKRGQSKGKEKPKGISYFAINLAFQGAVIDIEEHKRIEAKGKHRVAAGVPILR